MMSEIEHAHTPLHQGTINEIKDERSDETAHLLSIYKQMRSISSGEQRSTLDQGRATKKSEMHKVFFSYRAHLLHAQPTGKLATGVTREK